MIKLSVLQLLQVAVLFGSFTILNAWKNPTEVSKLYIQIKSSVNYREASRSSNDTTSEALSSQCKRGLRHVMNDTELLIKCKWLFSICVKIWLHTNLLSDYNIFS